ncbi:MAG TPA: Gfo/Idh/MocA family oxidoreductase [Gaiellaceae bacterium]|nr:Gfo/Idh/MocA family oxidoreductase [Gaiellaceae bacterium]
MAGSRGQGLLEPGAAFPRDGRARAPLRLGVIGLGAVAQAVHLPLVAKHPDLFRCAALCDLSRASLDVLGERAGVPDDARFAEAGELLEEAELDAVAVLTSGSHGGLAFEAARRGLAVFCEKPLAFTLAEADALAELEPRLALGYMKLYDPAVERAREALEGRPPARSVEVTVLHPTSAAQLAHAGLLPAPADLDAATLEELRTAEDALVEAALGDVPPEIARAYVDVLAGSIVHELAVIRYLLGEPLTVDDADAWPETPGAAPPSVALTGRLAGGARVSIRWHYLPSYPAYREQVSVHDEAGSVTLVFPSPYLLHAPTTLTVTDVAGGGEQTTRFRSTAEAFERQWLAFAELALEGAAPRAGVAEGRADIVVCQQAAAALAARRGVRPGGEAAGRPPANHEAGFGVETRDGRGPSMSPVDKEGTQ